MAYKRLLDFAASPTGLYGLAIRLAMLQRVQHSFGGNHHNDNSRPRLSLLQTPILFFYTNNVLAWSRILPLWSIIDYS